MNPERSVVIRTRWGTYETELDLGEVTAHIKAGLLIPISSDDDKRVWLNPCAVATVEEQPR